MGFSVSHGRGGVLRWVTCLLYGACALIASAQAQTPAPAAAPSLALSPALKTVDVPHIALLLPVDSPTFRRHAEALRDGFLAASQIPDPPALFIRVYPVGEDPKTAVASYQQAVNTGARLVIGPLVRGAVNAVVNAGDINVPTLLLNAPDGPLPYRTNLFVVSLQIEAEARQAARVAYGEGRRSALTVVGDSQVLRRVHQAFIETFVKLGGKHAGELRFGAGAADFERMREAAAAQTADMAFLALDARQARTARAMLDPLALYASSQAYSPDAAGIDSQNGVRLLDMPWLLQRDHAAVMIYPRQTYNDPDLDRLYALGIDAWRIGQAMLARHTDITLDGVTGKLTLGRDRQFTRELVMQRAAASAAPDVPPGAISPAPPQLMPSAVIKPPAAKP